MTPGYRRICTILRLNRRFSFVNLHRWTVSAYTVSILAGLLSPWSAHAHESRYTVSFPKVILQGVHTEMQVQRLTRTPWPSRLNYTIRPAHTKHPSNDRHQGSRAISLNHRRTAKGVTVDDLVFNALGKHRLRIDIGHHSPIYTEVWVLPGWLVGLPALIAFLIIILTRHMILGLLLSICFAALLIERFNPLQALLSLVDDHLITAMQDREHATLLLIVLFLGGLVTIIRQSGGAQQLASRVIRVLILYNPRCGMGLSGLLGTLVFFDDYVSTLWVGSFMRPIVDRLGVSREKLAFLVDTTAAPIACIAALSSWTGVQVNHLANTLQASHVQSNPYIILLRTLPYCFYPCLIVFFGLLIIVTRRDFGPMYHAAKARSYAPYNLPYENQDLYATSEFDDSTLAPSTQRWDWAYAFIPMLVFLLTAAGGMYLDGYRNMQATRHTLSQEAKEAARLLDHAKTEGHAEDAAIAIQKLTQTRSELYRIKNNATHLLRYTNSIRVLLWAISLATLIAVLLLYLRRHPLRKRLVSMWVRGFRSVVFPCIMLVLAWVFSALCQQLQLPAIMASSIHHYATPGCIPLLLGLLAAALSFSMGSAWATMAMLFPLVTPLITATTSTPLELLMMSSGAILSGAVWGDHCSPVSDTTLLTSMATTCEPVAHVRTQLPYALVVGGISFTVGTAGSGFGLYPPWVGLVLGMALCLGVLMTFGRHSHDALKQSLPSS